MTTIKRTILTIVTFLFTACGGGGGDTTESPIGGAGDTSEPSALMMKKNQAYVMKEGQTIVRNSDPTVMLLETDIKTGITTATLQSGSASIE